MHGRHRRAAGAGPGPARKARLTRPVLAGAVAAGLLATVLLNPAAPVMARLAARLAAALPTLGLSAHRAMGPGHTAAPAGTMAAVGALFQISGSGRRAALGRHFCTGTVVDSPAGDLVLTAAHCVSGRSPGQFAFVPEYRDGRAPDGVWPVSRVIVDRSWLATASPADDIAFLIVRRPGRRASVQSRTGADRLGFGPPGDPLVRVSGYPNTAAAPVSCQRRVTAFGPAELRFDCAGFADGTSGSALLANVDPVTGLGTVIGVIGGYQQGGDTDSVSYADRLSGKAATLYRMATARS